MPRRVIRSPTASGRQAGQPEGTELAARSSGARHTGADLVFKVDHRNGDPTSLVYRGTEYQGYGRVIDHDHVGWRTGKVGLWMVRSNHEKASGGPFYRSLMRHHYEDGAGLYEILYYGENQTEPMRFGLQGPYVLAFTDGGAPADSLRHKRRSRAPDHDDRTTAA